jgi:hypothetical protein
MCAFGIMIAFIPSMNVDPIIRTILGFVCIVLFGVPVVLLFFGLLFNLGELKQRVTGSLLSANIGHDPCSLWICFPTQQAAN